MGEAPPDRWRDPLKAIACTYAGDDLAYATHGGQLAAQVIRFAGIHPPAKVLDLGSGTGRVARVLATYYGSVVAFDPSPECHAVALEEAKRCPPANVHYTCDWKDVQAHAPYSVVACISVIEHLGHVLRKELIDRIKEVAPGGVAVLWYPIGFYPGNDYGDRIAVRAFRIEEV